MKTIDNILARRLILWSSLLGLFASAYLFYTYATSSDIKCGLLHGCELVRVSKWASVFGIPTPTFGLIFYFAVIALLIFRVYSPKFRPTLTNYLQKAFGIIGFLESLYLFGVQTFIIKSYCTWCLVSALAATLIFIFIWFDRNSEIEDTTANIELQLYFWSLLFGLIGIALLIFLLI